MALCINQMIIGLFVARRVKIGRWRLASLLLPIMAWRERMWPPVAGVSANQACWRAHRRAASTVARRKSSSGRRHGDGGASTQQANGIVANMSHSSAAAATGRRSHDVCRVSALRAVHETAEAVGTTLAIVMSRRRPAARTTSARWHQQLDRASSSSAAGQPSTRILKQTLRKQANDAKTLLYQTGNHRVNPLNHRFWRQQQ